MNSASDIPEHIKNLTSQILENFVVVQKEGENVAHDIKGVRSFLNDNEDWEIRIII